VKKVFKILIISVILLQILSSTGCWEFTLGPVQAPYITKEPPYIVLLQFPYRENERILDVVVREEVGATYDHTYTFETRWHIKAIEPVLAENFKVTVGEVPIGFKQLVPENREPFRPIAGRKYVVKIKTTNSGADYCSWWAPKTEPK
jgi:hypothetical protein